MNYIKQLQKNLRRSQDANRAANDGLNDLLRYVNSAKFYDNSSLSGYVSVNDVILRVNEIKSSVDNAFLGE